MKWTYIIKNKLAASAALFSLCLLVLASNFIDRNHTKNVKNTISTLYEDRLIAEEYILKMTGAVYKIKEVIYTDTSESFKADTINNLLREIRDQSNAYQKTKFTEVEKVKANKLMIAIDELESAQLKNAPVKLEYANSALVLLNELSAIQLNESKQIMKQAETLYLSGKTSSRFVFAVIIIILLVLQALVFASKSVIPKIKTKSPHLN